MKKVGITGQNGFIGKHLYNTLGLTPEEFERIEFQREFFDDNLLLDKFTAECDVIVHLAAVNKDEDEQRLYSTNTELAEKLSDSLKRTKSEAHVIISSSTQEKKDNAYGTSKKRSRTILAKQTSDNGGIYTGLIIPNVFGAFGKPFYNSFISTFCYELTRGDVPKVDVDAEVSLIYVQELVDLIISKIKNADTEIECLVMPTATKKVSEVLDILNTFREEYFDKGNIPFIKNNFEHNLFNTYRSYINYKTHYPVKFKQNTDERGAFVEIIRLGIGGQCSFSTTVSGFTRGNHFHTRKIERFAVIRGKALIQLRKIDSDEILEFDLNQNEPSYIDIPVWYTHNIKNVGNEDLYTIFWINEPFNSADPDTYFLTV